MICLNFWPAEALMVKYLAELTFDVLMANAFLKLELETVAVWSLVEDVLRAVVGFLSFPLLADCVAVIESASTLSSYETSSHV